MVAAVRQGQSLRAVARPFRVSLRTVQIWVARAHDQRLDRVDWTDRPRGGRRPSTATATRIEDLVVRLRQQLKKDSALGEYGAAIRRELQKRRLKPLPSLRTIGRILQRRGLLDGRRRVRRPPPPKGWYLPRVAAARAELDSFDFVEGLVIRGGTDVMVLNTVSLHGGLYGSWVRSAWTAKTTPVFAPPRETGFQAAIENYNGRWQAKVWQRFEHDNLQTLTGHSDRFVAAVRQRSAPRRDSAPARMAFPADWELDLQRPLQGMVISLRRTNEQGEAEVLGRRYPVDPPWPHRLVRAEVDLTKGRIRFYRPRRREPKQQPLLKTITYKPPSKAFHE